MLKVRCPVDGEEYHADEAHIGKNIKCRKCGKIISIERPTPAPVSPRGGGCVTAATTGGVEPATKVSTGPPGVLGDRRVLAAIWCLAALIVVILLVELVAALHSPVPEPVGGPANGTQVAAATTPPETKPPNALEAKQREIIAQDAGMLGDLELSKEYLEINAQHFGNGLPRIPVIWEPKLGELGPLIAEGFTEEGLTAQYNNRLFILLNPALRLNRREVRRALCHEMVHLYLITIGDTKTNHGPAFQTVLRRLSEERAFEGKWASESEKVSLRSWLEGESARLNREKSELERIRDDLDREGGDLDREMHELNQRISSANQQGYGWPSDDEVESVRSRRDLFNEHAVEFNARVEQYDGDQARFNRRVNSYNLTMSYPDGLDEESAIRPRPAVGRVPLRSR